MNVYVRALASALARAGVECDVYTRAEHRDAAGGGRGRARVPGGARRRRAARADPEATSCPALVDPFVDESIAPDPRRSEPVDVLHANYWLSGAVAHRLKHELDLPLVATFHTLARVKAEAGVDDDPEQRARVEHEVIACADLMLASTDDERDQLAIALRRGRPSASRSCRRVSTTRCSSRPIATRSPSDRLGLDGRRVLLFVGRIQPLKGADLAVRSPRRARRSRRRCCSWSAARAAPTARASRPGCTTLARRARRRRQRAFRAAAAAHDGSPTTTAPPTCASCRRAPSRSGSSRSRPPRAERRSSRPRSAGCARSSTTADRLPRRRSRPGRLTRRRSRSCSPTRARGARWARRASARSRKLLVEHHRGALRRLYGDLVARGLVRCD